MASEIRIGGPVGAGEVDDLWRKPCVAEAEAGPQLWALLMHKCPSTRPTAEEAIKFDDDLTRHRQIGVDNLPQLSVGVH